MKKKLIVYVTLILLASGNYFLWQHFHPYTDGQLLPERLTSISWDPFHYSGYNPEKDNTISEEKLESDIQQLAKITRGVRIYQVTDGLEKVAPIAKKYGLNVIAGVGLYKDQEANKKEVDALIEIANTYDNVTALVVGNEVILRGFLTPKVAMPHKELYRWLDYVRERTNVPVSTSEPYNLWLEFPALAWHVDFVVIHTLPYWYDIPAGQAVDWVYARHQEMAKAFPDKTIVIGETGWPSAGPQHGRALPSLKNHIEFVTALTRDLRFKKIQINLFEAFDQPWKVTLHEGRVGAHWGILTSSGEQKLNLQKSFTSWENWQLWAALSTLLAILGGIYLTNRTNELSLSSHIYGCLVVQIVSSTVAIICWTMAKEYMIGTIHMWIILPVLFLLCLILISQLLETMDVLGGRPLRLDTKGGTETALTSATEPFVSIHIACRNEPPAMMIATIKHLLALNYCRYEILVIDNNTTDDRYWMPVSEFCNLHTDRIKFFSLKDHPGFKAGALNFALKHSSACTDIIAVIDADYQVKPQWLSAAAPLFENKNVGVVQAPQAYRNFEDSLLQTMERDEYEGFFRIGMVQRNEANALIQHGTMTLIRKSVMDEIGGWEEWCITEDTELGIRVLRRGYEIRYINEPYGYGLVPLTFSDYCAQRTRWVYGAIRMLIHYRQSLFGWKDKSLTLRQRYFFIAGWLPWLVDSLHPLFCVIGSIMLYQMISDPRYFPPYEFALPLVLFIAFRYHNVYWTYEKRVKIGTKRRLLTMVAGAALTNTISFAVIRGLFTKNYAFHRTNKVFNHSRVTNNLWRLLCKHVEKILTLILLVEAGLLIGRYGIANQDGIVWGIAALTLSLPGLCAVFMEGLSAFETRSKYGTPDENRDFELPEAYQQELALAAEAALVQKDVPHTVCTGQAKPDTFC